MPGPRPAVKMSNNAKTSSGSGGKKNTQQAKRRRPSTPTSPEPDLIPAIRSMMDMQLDKINERFTSLEVSMKEQIRQFETTFSDIKEALSFQGKETEELKRKVADLERNSKEKESELKNEIDRLAVYVARENMVFFGIPEKEEEDVREVLREFYINSMKLPPDEASHIEYQRVHRVPSKSKPRPIKARVVRYQDKERILRNARNLKGTRMYVTEDYPLRVRKQREAQMPALKAARRVGKLAYFSRSEPCKLYIDRVWMPQAHQANFVQSLPEGAAGPHTGQLASVSSVKHGNILGSRNGALRKELRTAPSPASAEAAESNTSQSFNHPWQHKVSVGEASVAMESNGADVTVVAARQEDIQEQ